MIRAIIFDCFGVLATENWQAFKRQYFGDDPEKMQRAVELNRMSDAGLIDFQEVLDGLAEMTGRPVNEIDKLLKGVSANQELLQFIADRLKPKYKIGLLSNVADSWLHTLFTEEQYSLFDAKVLSHETGVIKPDERAYHIAAERLDVGLGECVFIDDQERNVTGAREAGMKALQYKDFEQFQNELEALLQKS